MPAVAELGMSRVGGRAGRWIGVLGFRGLIFARVMFLRGGKGKGDVCIG